MREYLIVYLYSNGKSKWGFGNSCIEIEGKLDFKAIRDVEAKIKAKNNFKSLAIMNVIPLESEVKNEGKD